MGYLIDNLPQTQEQIVECDKLYKYVLKIARRKPRIIEIATNQTELFFTGIVASIVGDAEEWQFNGTSANFHHYRFHLPSQRAQVVAQMNAMRIFTETRDDP